MRIDALNHALKGIPPERSRYHICWGSWNGPHAFDVPMKDIVDLLLQVNVGHYSFEAANPRHEHEWTVWQEVKLPPGKVLIPGVISHATNIVEHPELVAQRIVRLAKIVGRENVMGGTDCGFAQSPVRAARPSTIMWAKLKSLVEGAKTRQPGIVGQALRGVRRPFSSKDRARRSTDRARPHHPNRSARLRRRCPSPWRRTRGTPARRRRRDIRTRCSWSRRPRPGRWRR